MLSTYTNNVASMNLDKTTFSLKIKSSVTQGAGIELQIMACSKPLLKN